MAARGAAVPIPEDVVCAKSFAADAPATVKADLQLAGNRLQLDGRAQTSGDGSGDRWRLDATGIRSMPNLGVKRMLGLPPDRVRETMRHLLKGKAAMLPLNEAALTAAESVPSLPFVEVGSYCGRSTVWLGAAARAARPALKPESQPEPERAQKPVPRAMPRRAPHPPPLKKAARRRSAPVPLRLESGILAPACSWSRASPYFLADLSHRKVLSLPHGDTVRVYALASPSYPPTTST